MSNSYLHPFLFQERLSSVSDAEFPAESPRELSDNGMSHSRSSMKIQELDRYIELLHQEVALTRQELRGVRRTSQQEVAETLDDIKVCKYHPSLIFRFKYVIPNMVVCYCRNPSSVEVILSMKAPVGGCRSYTFEYKSFYVSHMPSVHQKMSVLS